MRRQDHFLNLMYSAKGFQLLCAFYSCAGPNCRCGLFENHSGDTWRALHYYEQPCAFWGGNFRWKLCCRFDRHTAWICCGTLGHELQDACDEGTPFHTDHTRLAEIFNQTIKYTTKFIPLVSLLLFRASALAFSTKLRRAFIPLKQRKNIFAPQSLNKNLWWESSRYTLFQYSQWQYSFCSFKTELF